MTTRRSIIMEGGMSRSTSTPFLPRYQSPSPARSPHLEVRRSASLRSISQPSHHIYYIDNSPSKVINSYHVHSSPPRKRTYKIHLCSAKTNSYLTRATRSQSVYDINSSHLYTSQENIAYKPFKDAASRRVGSCEDIYHKATFFPDITPSESGVSFGESEEESAFGGEDDNVSQQSFDSSSAYYEVTMDSELDKCDSDNFSGPDCVGDRSSVILRENSKDKSSKKKHKEGPHHRDSNSYDSFTSLLSRIESRNKEPASRMLGEVDKAHSRSEALRVIIPDNESPTKVSSYSTKSGDKKATTSSTPLAHSTPHVSPGGPDELKLHATTSWNADDPFEEVRNYNHNIKYATTKTAYEPENESKLSFKLEDSSCASSCSEDNYSDVSNITISSQGSRKTKLVKKPSDKPASAKRTPLTHLSDLPSATKVESTWTDNNNGFNQQHSNTTSENFSGDDSGCFTSTLSSLHSFTDKNAAANNVKYGEIIGKSGREWWTAYSMDTVTEQEAKVESELCDNKDKLFSFSRDVRVQKPLSMNIPLISAGKHGQEKLKLLSLTSETPSVSSSQSVSETAQTKHNGKYESHKVEDVTKVNQDGKHLSSKFGESAQIDHEEYNRHNLAEQKEATQINITAGKPLEKSVTPIVVNETVEVITEMYKSLPNRDVSQSETCIDFVQEKTDCNRSKKEDDIKNQQKIFPSSSYEPFVEKANIVNANNVFIGTKIINGSDLNDKQIVDRRIPSLDKQQGSEILLQETDNFVINSQRVEKDANVRASQQPSQIKEELTYSDKLEGNDDGGLTEHTTSDNAEIPELTSQVSEQNIPCIVPCCAPEIELKRPVNKNEISSEQEFSKTNSYSSVSKESICEHPNTDIIDVNSLDIKASNGTADLREEKHVSVAIISENKPITNYITLIKGEPEEQVLSSNSSLADVSNATKETVIVDNKAQATVRDSLIKEESRETLQINVHVISTEQRSVGSVEEIDIPVHENSAMSHHSQQPLFVLSEKDSLKTSETMTVSSEHLQNGTDHAHFNSHANTKQAHSDEPTIYSTSQLETVGTSVCTDISRPVDESINGQGSVAVRGDRGFHKDHFCTEKTELFIDRGEEFIHSPGVHEKLLVVTETIRQIEHIHRVTLDRFVTNKQVVNNSLLDYSTSGDYSHIKTDNSVVHTVVNKVQDNEVITIHGHDSDDNGKENTVSDKTVKSYRSVRVNSTNTLPTSDLTIALSETAVEQGLESIQPDNSSHIVSKFESTYLAPKIEPPTVHSLSTETNKTDITSSEISRPATSDFETPITSKPTTSTSVTIMPNSDQLDNLHAQLTFISNDTPSSPVNNLEHYHDYAEATSVLKQIVRGDATEFSQFSTPSCGTESTIVVTGELNDRPQALQELKEYYDNDYEYVSTDFTKGSKLFPRPHQQQHPSKSGQLKNSSLWTLQEETESAANTLSPKSSPKLPRVSLVSQNDNCSYGLVHTSTSLHADLVKGESMNIKSGGNKTVGYGNKAFKSESSDFDESDGNYSSISTSDSDSRKSSSFGREQTPLSEVEFVKMDNQVGQAECHDTSKILDTNSVSVLPHSDLQQVERSLSGSKTEDGQSRFVDKTGKMEYGVTDFGSNLLSNNNHSIKNDNMSPLDRLCASLEQFTEPSTDGWRLIVLAESATTASDYRGNDTSTNSAHLDESSDDDTVSDNSWRHNLNLDTSRGSLTSTDVSEGSVYKSTVRAEIKKTSFDYDIPTTAETSTNLKRTHSEFIADKVHDEKIKQFENLLDEFSKSILPNAVISEFIFLREKRSDSSSSSSEDLYKSFTNEDSEKKQNHVCIVVEDENMNTFRFKRYLKKSHTNRKNGKPVVRFLSKLGCVIESMNSPFGSPSRQLKQSTESIADSLSLSKHTASDPILISSTSFQRRDVLNNSPLGYTYDYNSPFTGNRSFDSIRSKADSAYSSISESVAGTLNSPASQYGPSPSFRVPPASSGSVSSVFNSGSTSGEWSFSDSVFPISADDSMHTSNSLKKDFSSHNMANRTSTVDRDKMSSLSDVFEQLNVCEDEIDNALLSRVRHGHVKAQLDKR